MCSWDLDLVLVVRDVRGQGLHLAVEDVVLLHFVLHRRQVLAKAFVGQVVLGQEPEYEFGLVSNEARYVQSSGIQVFTSKDRRISPFLSAIIILEYFIGFTTSPKWSPILFSSWKSLQCALWQHMTTAYLD